MRSDSIMEERTDSEDLEPTFIKVDEDTTEDGEASAVYMTTKPIDSPTAATAEHNNDRGSQMDQQMR